VRTASLKVTAFIESKRFCEEWDVRVERDEDLKDSTPARGSKPACGFGGSQVQQPFEDWNVGVSSCLPKGREHGKNAKASRASDIRPQAPEPFWTKSFADYGWRLSVDWEAKGAGHWMQTDDRC